MKLITDDNDFTAFFTDATYAVVKYHTEKDCEDCVRLLPVYKQLEHAPEFQHIKFGMMSADNNPAAQALITSRKLPFVAVYKDSLLVECGTITSEADLRTMLNNLPYVNINLK